MTRKIGRCAMPTARSRDRAAASTAISTITATTTQMPAPVHRSLTMPTR
jgi:hypothetical protein